MFIGFDERQPLTHLVCKESIIATAQRPCSIYSLRHRTLRDIGFLTRQWEITQDGTTKDKLDGRPFSTNFAFSRFLTPHYARYLGVRATDVVVFVDSDFVFLRDINSLFDEFDPREHPLWCVQHQYSPSGLLKMDGQTQVKYPKKLWSSLMVFNMMNPACIPSLKDVNEKSGTYLHEFDWLPKGATIGSIHEGWNFIPDHSEPRVKEPEIRAIHYTEGTPLMKPECKYSAVYNNYLREVLEKAASDPLILGAV